MSEFQKDRVQIFPDLPANAQTDNKTPNNNKTNTIKKTERSKKTRPTKQQVENSEKTIFGKPTTPSTKDTREFEINKKPRSSITKIKQESNSSLETDYLSFKRAREDDSFESLSVDDHSHIPDISHIDIVDSSRVLDLTDTSDRVSFEPLLVEKDIVKDLDIGIERDVLERVDVCEKGNVLNESNNSNNENNSATNLVRDTIDTKYTVDSRTVDKDTMNNSDKIENKQTDLKINHSKSDTQILNEFSNENSMTAYNSKDKYKSDPDTKRNGKNIPSQKDIRENKLKENSNHTNMKNIENEKENSIPNPNLPFYNTYLYDPVFTEKEQVEDGTSLFRKTDDTKKRGSRRFSRRQMLMILLVLFVLVASGLGVFWFVYKDKEMKV